ncbi:MAG: cupin domain-containing protein [Methylicorpusculum sp.]|uniref:cupin domain-containing protein n=1 Tax=Methylicorpusculum sp. TaxID=2713644 RepID=UPI0027211775|nr:cupin domain-containing protein [Methylicorpusculum sp.]MDO8845778.1 cupin domain-containing protein [Methylicorpusculum sp.]MDO8937881.1 cupin domain-containing protein [Methylicorpusculum sp.]MDO9239735.1 cupin domain-containing protein [Methylicorpusculum sp.]MDP2200662.1 cupin domain-containing protein [Methylicorpusculum sp.]
MNKQQRFNSANRLIGLSAAIFILGLSPAEAKEKPQFERKVLSAHKVELPSNHVNAKTIKVTFPPAFKTPDHVHEGPGPRYVVKGKLKVIEGDHVGVYSAGDTFWETGSLMSVENVGNGPAELIIFELAPVK